MLPDIDDEVLSGSTSPVSPSGSLYAMQINFNKAHETWCHLDGPEIRWGGYARPSYGAGRYGFCEPQSTKKFAYTGQPSSTREPSTLTSPTKLNQAF